MLILYIHGFLSSPQSWKAQQVEDYCLKHNPSIAYLCPALPVYPQTAMAILEDVVEENKQDNIGLVGSSMGGYYATYLSQRFQLPAVLINPAVRPYEMMINYLDQELKNYHTDEVSCLQPHHVEELRALETNQLQYPELLWLLAQKGDETLDYRQAVEKYNACQQTIEDGGDHSFQQFERWIPQVITYLQKHSK